MTRLAHERVQDLATLPEVLTPRDLSELFGVCLSSVDEALRRGQLPCLWIGGRRLIPRRTLQRLFEGQIVKTERGWEAVHPEPALEDAAIAA